VRAGRLPARRADVDDPVDETAKPRTVPVRGDRGTETIVPPATGGAEVGPGERPVSAAGPAAPNGKS
jgi:hypothetical protein